MHRVSAHHVATQSRFSRLQHAQHGGKKNETMTATSTEDVVGKENLF
jgi:hypothetical protein